MHLRLDQLEALHWIARLGSFRAAATQLNLTQSTISARIRLLERRLGVELFDRGAYRARLTASGRELARDAERMVALVGELERRSVHGRPSRGVLWGTIRLGVCDTFALTGLPGLLSRLERRFPELQVALDIDHSVNLDTRLQDGRLDFAFLTRATPAPQLACVALTDLPLAWVASPQRSFPARPLTPADLKAAPVITNPPGSLLHANIRDWFAAAGELPGRINTCTSLDIMIRLAVAGFGVALLPLALVGQELRRGRLRVLPTEPPAPSHPLVMAHAVDPTGPDLSVICDVALGIARARRDLRPPRAKSPRA